MESPSLMQQRAALETLRAAGFSFSAPYHQRLQHLTVNEVMGVLGFERRRIERMLQAGEFPNARHFGTDVRIPLGDVEAYTVRQPLVFSPSIELRRAA